MKKRNILNKELTIEEQEEIAKNLKENPVSKKDERAMLLAALVVFLPVLLIIIGIFLVVIWFFFLR